MVLLWLVNLGLANNINKILLKINGLLLTVLTQKNVKRRYITKFTVLVFLTVQHREQLEEVTSSNGSTQGTVRRGDFF